LGLLLATLPLFLLDLSPRPVALAVPDGGTPVAPLTHLPGDASLQVDLTFTAPLPIDDLAATVILRSREATGRVLRHEKIDGHTRDDGYRVRIRLHDETFASTDTWPRTHTGMTIYLARGPQAFLVLTGDLAPEGDRLVDLHLVQERDDRKGSANKR